jgi:ankyrin repeat protein
MGATPLAIAKGMGHATVVELLLKAGADPRDPYVPPPNHGQNGDNLVSPWESEIVQRLDRYEIRAGVQSRTRAKLFR